MEPSFFSDNNTSNEGSNTAFPAARLFAFRPRPPPSANPPSSKYALAAAKAVSPRGLQVNFSQAKGRYGCSSYDDSQHRRRHGVGSGKRAGSGPGGGTGMKGVKTFGGTTVRVVLQ